MARDTGRMTKSLLAYSLGFPEAWEDHPWGETAVKVGKKLFVIFGGDGREHPRGMTVKLGDSHGQASASSGVEPTGYGLGRSGWVSVNLHETTVPVVVLKDWIEESYRLIAPKRARAVLDEG